MKLCLDTNVLVSAFATRGLCEAILQMTAEDNLFELLLPAPILVELDRALTQKLHLPPDIHALDMAVVAPFAQKPIETHELPPLPPGDAEIVAAAEQLGVRIFVTGDQEILALERFKQLRLVSPRQFWELTRVPTHR